MTYLKLAKAVSQLHAFWIMVLLGNIVLAVFVPEARPFSSAIVIVTGFSQMIWGACPLTVLERSLRVKAGEEPREGSYLVDFFRRRFGIEVPPWVITAQMVVLMIIAVYMALAGYLDGSAR